MTKEDLELIIQLKFKAISEGKYEIAHDLKHWQREVESTLNSQWTEEILTGLKTDRDE